MNRHYKKKNRETPKRMFIAYKDYAPWSGCTNIFGLVDKFEDALSMIEEDANWRETLGYKKTEERFYNKKIEDLHYVKDGCYVTGVSVRLGNRIGEVYELNMSKTGKKYDETRIRYVIFQTYVNMQTPW